MLHEFRGKTSGTRFFYCNRTNALYDANRNLLSKPLGRRDNTQAPNEIVNPEHVVKSKSPREIKIVFGHKCNYSCGYCIQKDLGNHNQDHVDKSAQSRIPVLLDKLRSSLDLSRLEQVELWGGEVFLFWNEVREVMIALDHPGMDFVIPTNGTILAEHHIDFFTKLQGRVSIEMSHDGPLHELKRGPDFLERKIPVFQKIEQNPDKVRIIINVVVSKGNCNFIWINDYFRDFFTKHSLCPVPLFFMPLMVHDGNAKSHSLQHSLEEYTSNITIYLNAQYDQFKRLGRVEHERLLQSQLFHIDGDGDDNHGILQMAAMMRSQLDELSSTICGMHQSDKLVIDVNGDIKACQNVDGVGENITQITDNGVLISGISLTNERDQCTVCPVRLQCFGGCPLDVSKDAFDINCQLSKSHNMAKLLLAFKILTGEDVELC